MRADVNVSVCRAGNYDKFRETGDFKYLGTRTETKNVNSIRYVRQVIDYEARRQIEVLEAGGKIDQETRLFDVKTGTTRTMRSKEDAHDYRYFPDPDLLPLEFEQAWVDEIKASLPELPDAKKHRFIEQYGLSAYDASVLAADQASAAYFEEVAKGGDGKLASNWVTGELFGALNKAGKEIGESPVSAAQLGELIGLIKEGVISGKIAKDIFALMFEGEETGSPKEIVEKRGLKQVTDAGAIEKVVDEIIAANPQQVAQVKEKPKTMGWFVGQVMQKTGGKANPQAVNDILKKKLGIE